MKSKNKKSRTMCGIFLVFKQLDLFLNLGSLADSVTYVVELCSSYFTLTGYDDFINTGRMERESLLNAYAVCDSSYGERFGDSAVSLGNNRALEKLDSLTGTLFDLVVNDNSIAHLKLRHFSLQLLAYKSRDLIHCDFLLLISERSYEHAADRSFAFTA